MASKTHALAPSTHLGPGDTRGRASDPALADRAAYDETLSAAAYRWAMGTVFALMPKRIGNVPHLLWNMAQDLARGGTRIPEQSRTWPRPDTFAGVCREPSPETVLEAARQGFFPWCHCGPLKWWTRKERMVLFFPEYHLSKTLRRDMRAKGYRVTFDQAFDRVILACAGRRSYNNHALTWITPQIMRLYSALFDQGHAHSFEVWSPDGRLVGGGYGLSVGRVFITESLFSHEPSTSKMGFAVLNWHLAKWGYTLNDVKDSTPMFQAMGLRLIPREEYEAILRDSTEIGSSGGAVGRWSAEITLHELASWKPGVAQAAAA